MTERRGDIKRSGGALQRNHTSEFVALRDMR